mgnify:CR=1 FL=1
MQELELYEDNPLDKIDVSFQHYLNRRKNAHQKHLEGGIPDYAYDLDYELRQKMTAIPHFERMCKAVSGTIENRQLHIINQEGLAVGPDQFPEVYQAGVDCARTLGIGIPNIYVVNNVQMNAYTCATDDASPLIVIYSGMLERMTKRELKAVIGHECGHIHNRHAVFQNVIDILLGTATRTLGGVLLTQAGAAAMLAWSRAAEVTADRAALICSDEFEDVISGDKKMLYGAAFGDHEVQIEPLRKQLERMLNNPTAFLELQNTHPGTARRIVAEMEFMECETLYQWRPEKKQPGLPIRSKKETDARCRKFIALLAKGK